MLRFLTAGESHGQALVAVIEGMPAGVPIDLEKVTAQLKRRQGGYGRGRRMAIESDKAQVLSGIRRGRTTGAPIALLIPNKDWQNWQKTMHVEPEMPEEATGANRAAVTRPRPGHADLAGALKYDLTDIRDVLERASARGATPCRSLQASASWRCRRRPPAASIRALRTQPPTKRARPAARASSAAITARVGEAQPRLSGLPRTTSCHASSALDAGRERKAQGSPRAIEPPVEAVQHARPWRPR